MIEFINGEFVDQRINLKTQGGFSLEAIYHPDLDIDAENPKEIKFGYLSVYSLHRFVNGSSVMAGCFCRACSKSSNFLYKDLISGKIKHCGCLLEQPEKMFLN